jgi:hypothetical protein
VWERDGKREFFVEEGNERSECWKTVGFQVDIGVNDFVVLGQGDKKKTPEWGVFLFLNIFLYKNPPVHIGLAG